MSEDLKRLSIRDIPDHATFRGKGVNAGWLDQLVVFSLWPYIIRATLTISSFQSMYSKQNMKTEKKIYRTLLFS